MDKCGCFTQCLQGGGFIGNGRACDTLSEIDVISLNSQLWDHIIHFSVLAHADQCQTSTELRPVYHLLTHTKENARALVKA
jgi:hypothetical protein